MDAGRAAIVPAAAVPGLGPSASIARVQLFLVAFQQPIPFGISAAVVILMIGIMLRSAMSAEGGSRWVAPDHEPERASSCSRSCSSAGRSSSGSASSSCPHEGANSPYGGIGLIALFSGFFIMMGLLWAVIGE